MNPILDMLLQFWWLLPLLLISAFLKSPTGKGVLGEFFINLAAKYKLDPEQYHLLKNVTLPTEQGGSTQIDHIILSRYGIFVLETKNYKGWITGKVGDKQWTQTIYKTKSSFQNPLHQNYKHTRTLEDLLGLKKGSVHAVIAFVGDCELKSKFPANITKGVACFDYIKSFKAEVYFEKQVQEMLTEIEELRMTPGLKTHIKHVINPHPWRLTPPKSKFLSARLKIFPLNLKSWKR